MDPGNMGPLGEWLPEAIWPKLKSLERIKRFQNIGDAMQSDSDEWQVTTRVSVCKLPGIEEWWFRFHTWLFFSCKAALWKSLFIYSSS